MYDGRLEAAQVLIYMIEQLKENLQDLNQPLREYGDPSFVFGEKTAFVECLEMIQLWSGAKRNGLGWRIEERYPIIHNQ